MSKYSSAKCYQNYEKRQQKKLGKEEKEERRKIKKAIIWPRATQKPQSLDEKQKLFEYRKKYYKMRKNVSL